MNNPNQEAITLADLEGLPDQILARAKQLGIEDGNPEALASLVIAIVECADDLSIFNGASDPDGNPESFTFYESEDFEILAKRLLSKIVASAGFKKFAQTKKLSDRIRDRITELELPSENAAWALCSIVDEIEGALTRIEGSLNNTNEAEFNQAMIRLFAAIAPDILSRSEMNELLYVTGNPLFSIASQLCSNFKGNERSQAVIGLVEAVEKALHSQDEGIVFGSIGLGELARSLFLAVGQAIDESEDLGAIASQAGLLPEQSTPLFASRFGKVYGSGHATVLGLIDAIEGFLAQEIEVAEEAERFGEKTFDFEVFTSDLIGCIGQQINSSEQLSALAKPLFQGVAAVAESDGVQAEILRRRSASTSLD